MRWKISSYTVQNQIITAVWFEHEPAIQSHGLTSSYVIDTDRNIAWENTEEKDKGKRSKAKKQQILKPPLIK